MVNLGVLFPGQGSQYVGMGKLAYENSELVRKIYEHADAILNFPLSKISFEGPEEKLIQTDISQPAIFVMSLALFYLIKEKNPKWKPLVGGGLSLGEWTALTAARSISFEDALKLVQLRGRYMQEACQQQTGAMHSVLGMTLETLEKLLIEYSYEMVSIANINSSNQVVISGDKTQIESFSTILKEKGAKKIIPLKVAGAFHSKLMESAKQKLALHLDSIEFHEMEFPIVSNYLGRFYESKLEIKEALLNQITGSVQWVKDMELMAGKGVLEYLEIGPNKVLKGLAKNIIPNAVIFNIETEEQIKDIFEKNQERGVL